MSSVSTRVDTGDDRSTKARIRDAAIECIARRGAGAATVRAIAAEAGVSPALVIHHYGTVDALREACNEHIASEIRTFKRSAIAEGTSIDVLGALRGTGISSIGGYLARVLIDDSDTVDRLVDELVDDAVAYMDEAVQKGIMVPTDDMRGRATVLLLWSLGALTLHRHTERLLGVDITDPALDSSSALARYALPVYEILGTGIFDPAYARHLEEAFATMITASDGESETTPS